MNKTLHYIRLFVKRGCAVLPLVEGGKKPAVVNGVYAANRNLRLITMYFTRYPKRNWAMATGEPFGIIALDIDGNEGEASLRQLEKAKGRLPKTSTIRTPHGQHIYLKAPTYRVPNSVSRVGPGIDVRGDGGYVVGPGSETPDGTYEVIPGFGPDEVGIAAAPKWLFKIIGKAPTPDREPARFSGRARSNSQAGSSLC
jgi:putative DNA primase/helicase